MCCQITTPGSSIKNPTTPKFRNRTIPRFDRNNSMMFSEGGKAKVFVFPARSLIVKKTYYANVKDSID